MSKPSRKRKVTRRQFLTGIAALAAGVALSPTSRAVCLGISNLKVLSTSSNHILCGASRGFDFYISPTGDDNNPGTLASPWSITALGTLPNRSNTGANGCRWNAYGGTVGKRIGILPGYYTQGSFNSTVTTLYNLSNTPNSFGPGCVLLLNGSGSATSPVVIAGCDSSGNALITPGFGMYIGPPQAIIDGSNGGVGGTTQASVSPYVGMLCGQQEDGTNGITMPPFWGNIVLQNLKFVGYQHYGLAFGNGIGGPTYGNNVSIINCEVGFGYGFHDNNPGAVLMNALSHTLQNCYLHDCYSSDATFYGQINASFSGTVMTLNSLSFGALNFIGRNPILYGAGLPANLQVTGLASGTYNQPGSTYNLSANVGTISSETVTFGWAGSIPAPWASNGFVGFNNGTVPSNIVNCSIQRTGGFIMKTHQQTVNWQYNLFEIGNYGALSGTSGPGGEVAISYFNIIWSTPAGAVSNFHHNICVAGMHDGTSFGAGNTNSGTNNVHNNTFYLPPSANVVGTPSFRGVSNDGVAGVTNEFSNLYWSDVSGAYSGGTGGELVVPAGLSGTFSDFNALQVGFKWAQAAFGTTYLQAAWTAATNGSAGTVGGLEGNSTTLNSTPFTTAPQAGTPSSYAITGPATTAGLGGGIAGAVDGTLSPIGLPIGCSFANQLPGAIVGTTYNQSLAAYGSGNWTITACTPNVLGWLTGNLPLPPGGYNTGTALTGLPQKVETMSITMTNGTVTINLTLVVNPQ